MQPFWKAAGRQETQWGGSVRGFQPGVGWVYHPPALRSSAQDRPVVTMASGLLPQPPPQDPSPVTVACPEGAALSGEGLVHMSLGGGSLSLSNCDKKHVT